MYYHQMRWVVSIRPPSRLDLNFLSSDTYIHYDGPKF